MRTFPQQRLVVIGGGNGLGRACALHFARAGWRVLVSDLDPADAQDTADRIVSAGGSAVACVCDVRDERALAAVAESAQRHWGGSDVWINNAGVSRSKAVPELSIDEWRHQLDTNLLGCARSTQVALAALDRVGGGHIVNVAGHISSGSKLETAADSATRAAIIEWSLTLRACLRGRAIGLSVACGPAFADRLAAEVFHAVMRNRFLITAERGHRWQNWRRHLPA
ncbi:SDR family NAD(P)-dependent oxidoreductase [Algiphilus sp. W345]|uniref:SDR family NAD(P)-dependent oxidoreductase n=1 Tax=Banduia mediterranea TaxID=3075609 RepID=A0ABU2WJ07_9GAMM|nr:SDR family NAD(P)-dependent oxidoreductase [Algiphilus sp. W345]MDT0497856.1 SDR family NAD(P)-dependent oxidoreductase [Algiphilus sp. W345]